MAEEECNDALDDSLTFCESIPKIELHAHLNGSISTSTMLKLLERKKSNELSEELEAWQSTIKKGQRSLEECFQVFKIVHEIVDDEEAVLMVARDVVTDFANDNVIYLELRSTPRANFKSGMTKVSYIEAMLKGVQVALRDLKSQIIVRILLSIDRSQPVADAEDTVLLAERFRKQTFQSNIKVVGVDLSGNPYVGEVHQLLPVLKSIKEKGLKFAAHLSEIASQNDETLLVLLQAVPDRVGHGTFMNCGDSTSKKIVDVMRSLKIPLELCLTSNLICKTVSSLNEHHFKFWRSHHHPIVLCTDDKGVFCTTLSREYHKAAKSFGLSKRDLQQLSMNSIEHIFEEDSIKKELRRQFSTWHSSTQ